LVTLHPVAKNNPYSVLEHIQNYNKLHIHKGALGQPRLRALLNVDRLMFLYFNLCLSVMLDSPASSFTFI
jgi:hypothetical protein